MLDASHDEEDSRGAEHGNGGAAHMKGGFQAVGRLGQSQGGAEAKATAQSSGRLGEDSKPAGQPPTWANIQQRDTAASEGEPSSGFRLGNFSALSSGSGHTLDQAIDAVGKEHGVGFDSADEEGDDEEKDSTQEQVRFMRSLNSLASVSSAEGAAMRGVLLATPFAAEDLQSADLAHWHSAASGGSLHEFLPGHSSLSGPEQDVYRAMVEELMSDGTLSSDMSELLNDMRISGICQGASAPEERSFVEAHKEKLDGVMAKLRSRLPPATAHKLTHFDSFGLLDLYNHHHARQNSGTVQPFQLGSTAMSQPS